jgi:hypothetical protein
MPAAAFNEIARALACGQASVQSQRFLHAGQPYIVYQGAVPGFKAGTLVATGYSASVVADGHYPSPDEFAAALDAIERHQTPDGHMNEERWRAALLLTILLGSAIWLSYVALLVLFPEKSFPALPQCIRCGMNPDKLMTMTLPKLTPLGSGLN